MSRLKKGLEFIVLSVIAYVFLAAVFHDSLMAISYARYGSFDSELFGFNSNEFTTIFIGFIMILIITISLAYLSVIGIAKTQIEIRKIRGS